MTWNTAENNTSIVHQQVKFGEGLIDKRVIPILFKDGLQNRSWTNILYWRFRDRGPCYREWLWPRQRQCKHYLPVYWSVSRLGTRLLRHPLTVQLRAVRGNVAIVLEAALYLFEVT